MSNHNTTKILKCFLHLLSMAMCSHTQVMNVQQHCEFLGAFQWYVFHNFVFITRFQIMEVYLSLIVILSG